MSTETVICTLRHAQSEYGAEGRYAGSVDVPLSEEGVRDCRAAAETLAARHFDIVVTSTMTRAVDTARLLGHDPATCLRTPLCNERRFGVFEGLTWDEARAVEPPVLFVEVGGDLHSVDPAGGEPLEDVWQRAKEFERFLLERCEGGSALVVSHGVFLQMFHGVLRGSNCISSLASYPSSLELSTFRLSGERLVEESESMLLHDAGRGF